LFDVPEGATWDDMYGPTPPTTTGQGLDRKLILDTARSVWIWQAAEIEKPFTVWSDEPNWL